MHYLACVQAQYIQPLQLIKAALVLFFTGTLLHVHAYIDVILIRSKSWLLRMLL